MAEWQGCGRGFQCSCLLCYDVLEYGTSSFSSNSDARHRARPNAFNSNVLCIIKAALTCLAWIIVHLSGHKQLFGQIMVYKESEWSTHMSQIIWFFFFFLNREVLQEGCGKSTEFWNLQLPLKNYSVVSLCCSLKLYSWFFFLLLFQCVK